MWKPEITQSEVARLIEDGFTIEEIKTRYYLRRGGRSQLALVVNHPGIAPVPRSRWCNRCRRKHPVKRKKTQSATGKTG